MGSHPINALTDTYVVTLGIGGPALSIIPMMMMSRMGPLKRTSNRQLHIANQRTPGSRAHCTLNIPQCTAVHFSSCDPAITSDSAMFSQISVCRKEKRSRSLETPRSREQFQSENGDYKVSCVRLKVTHLHWAG